MRKTSKYAKKKARQPVVRDMWLKKIQDNKPYSSESLFGETPTIVKAQNSINTVRSAYNRIDNRLSSSDKQQDYELLAHAVVISQIRTFDSEGEGRKAVMEVLNEAVVALEGVANTWRATKQWEMTAEQALVLADAVNIYEQIVLSSTPYEMEKAQTSRLDWLLGEYRKAKACTSTHQNQVS